MLAGGAKTFTHIEAHGAPDVEHVLLDDLVETWKGHWECLLLRATL
jgi:hypothetical protein